MTNYRIRLSNGRVIGPFTKVQLFDLKAKGHIRGNEEGQIYPTGEWKALSELDVYEELMDENRTVINTAKTGTDEGTFIIDLSKIRQKKVESELDAHDVSKHIPVENMTETRRISTPEPPPSENKDEKKGNTVSDRIVLGEEDLPEAFDEQAEKTLINPVAQEELQALRRKVIEEERARIEAEAFEYKVKAEEAPVPVDEHVPAVEPADESTQMIALENFGDLMEVAKREEKKIKKELRQRKAEADEEDDDDEESEPGPQESKKKRIKVLVIVGALALLYAILFPDEDKPKNPPFQFLPPQLVFPIPFDKADPQASKIDLGKGMELFTLGSYPALVKAGLHFKAAYENDLSNSQALNFMVRTYAEELQYSKQKLRDSQVLFNVIQSKRPFLIQDPNGVIGLNLFYMSNKKYDAAVDVISKYLKLNPKNVTTDLFATYLMSLIAVGKVDLAKQFYQALEKAPVKDRYTYEALIRYMVLNEETDKALKVSDEAIKKFPHLVRFYLLKSEILFKLRRYKEIEPLLAESSKRNLEYNDVNRAKFLEESGLFWAYKKDTQKATKLLNASLKLDDSSELRMKLADLGDAGSSTDTGRLIAESKAVKLLYQAKDFYEKKSFEHALSTAARATDEGPGYIPAELFLSKVQLRLGLMKQGLSTLEELIKKYPDNKEINLALIEAYISSYKFNDARTRIGIIATTDVRESWEFASVNGRLYLKMGDPFKAIGWLQASMRTNPLNDADIYLLAEILHKKASYQQSRDLLNKCIELDPVNPDYRIAYARLIYETQDDQAAIGYLLGLLDDFGENPKFLSEIAIFYYRAGKIKDFEDYKKKLEKLPYKDKALYEFLIRAALLDERYNDVPGLVEKLIEIEPGDLESMMTAGRVLFETGKLAEAALWFRRVQKKLPSYPKVQYYIAKVALLADDLDTALKDVQSDIKDNGESDLSLVLLGEIYVAKGDLVAGENYYKKAQKVNPRSYEALVGLADLSTKRNNYDLALDLYKRAMKQRSDEPVLHKKIGDVYRLLGQGSLAIESYKLYLEMTPEAPDKKKIDDYIQLMQ